MAGRAQEEKNSINVGKIERWFSALGGGGLVLYGLKRRSGPGLALALLGGVLIHRGATGHCYLYQAIGANTARRIPERATKGVVEVEKRITVALPPEALYPLWKNLESLPRFFDTLESVRAEADGRSFWVAGPDTGRQLEWEARLIEDRPNEALAWGAGEGGTAEMISVRYDPDPVGTGTQVRLLLKYDPTHSLLGVAFARLFGEFPEQALERTLDQFKRLTESGEISKAA